MVVQRLLPLVGALAAAVALASPAVAAEQSPLPVPSLTPASTADLWEQLVQRPRTHMLSRTAVCATPVRAVFYAANDWLRLATKLAANPSACTDYYISVPPLAADKTQFRSDQAWRIRALGPQFHALAEVNVTGWSGWVSTTGSSWHAAGVEARRRLAAAGYDTGAGDTWVVNELSSAVRQGVGSARANMRAFLRGLYEGDGTVAAARGAVFVIGIGQQTTELSVYQSRLQDWYEDAPFWEDMSRYVSDWTQEVYGDARAWAVPGADAATRASSLGEYLQHELALARVAPGSGAAAASFLAAAYTPLANAAWAYDASFGWTNVPSDLMQSYVSSQTAAMRSYRSAHLGFAWAPKNLNALAPADFAAQTDAVLVRLAAAIAGSDACAPSWCGGDLAGAAFNPGWQTFAAWKPTRLAFATSPQTLAPGAASTALTVQLQTNTGVAYTAGPPVAVTFSSSSAGGSFATGPSGPWTPTLTVEIASGASSASAYFRDTQSGSSTISASAAGRTAATQVETILPAAGTDPGGFFVGFAEDLPKEIGSAAVTPATQLGASAFRLTLTWSPGQTALSPFETKKLDRAVAAAAGTRIVLAVYGATADSAPTDAARRDQYCGYVRGVLARYPAIRDVVIWNEPNKSLFWRPQLNADGSVASAAAYEALLARCWDVLHAAHPDVNVLGLALSSTGNDDGGSRSPGDFIRRVGEAYRASGRTGRILDTVAYHPYPASASERPWRRHIGSKVIGMGDWNKLMYNLWLAFDGTAQPIPGDDGVGIWYTEIGFQTSVPPAKTSAYTGTENTATVPDWIGGEPEAPAPADTSPAPDQGTQALDAIRLAACQPHVGALFNFLLADEPILAGWQSGPLWADRSPKGSHEAFRQAIASATSAGVDCGALKGGSPSGDFMPPSRPAQVTAAAMSNPLRVDVSWAASTGDSSPVSYRIYKGGAWVGTSDATSWSDTTVTAGATYTYTVRAIDSAGNLGDASSGATVTVSTPDTTAPTVSVTAPAEGARVSGTVRLEASAADDVGVARVELLAGGVLVATVGAPPYAASWSSTSVPDGSVTIAARAVDAAGNLGTAAGRLITVDNTAPQATITSGPASSTSAISASFAFTANETGARFECSLDAGAFAACVSPQTYAGLSVGEHVFRVRAADPAGNVQQSPSERRWTIVGADTAPPETTIDAGPSGTVASTSASLAFSASEPNATFACRLDASAWVSCSSPQGYSTLAAGEHAFEVRATDASGNADPTPATRTWTVQAADTTPPQTVIDSGPATATTATTATFTFSSSEPGSSFACALDDATPSPCTSPASYTALAAGPHRLRVHSTDRSGNTDPTPAEWSWSIVLAPVDTTAPQTTIDSGPAGTAAASSATFAFSANETGARFECSLDGAAWASCSSPHALAGLAVGPHTFAVRAIDAAGNGDPTPAVREWAVEAQPAEPTPVPPPPPPPSGSGGGGGGAGPDVALQASASPAAPTVGSTLTYVLTARNHGSPAARVVLTVQLPSQVAYVSSDADRGTGCAGSTVLTCNLDFLAGDLVATVRVHVTVRETGTLVLTGTATSSPGDVARANDSVTVTTVVASAQPRRRAPQPAKAPVVRLLTPARLRVPRIGRTATLALRFSLNEAARVRVAVTPLRSRRALPLLRGTLLAGVRSTVTRTVATAAVARGGAYAFGGRITAARLVRGRTYLVRVTATDTDGHRLLLTLRVRAEVTGS